MNLTPEHVAKLIFAVSQLRYFEQQLLIDPNQEMHGIVIRWQCKTDEILCIMGVDQFMPYDQLLELIKLQHEKI
jgi:hypothetical protein